MQANQPLQGQTALVTGGGKRLGAATAEALAKAGADVAVHYRTSREEAETTARRCRAYGVNAYTVPADLADPDEALQLVPCAIELAGPIHILINSAAIFPESTLWDCTLSALEQCIRTNALAPLVLARSFAAQGIEGTVINFLDCRIADYDKNHVAYHLSKRMLFSLTRMMAAEFAPRVRVNAVAPGLILPPPGKDESYLASLAATNPLNRYGGPSDVTEAVLFLVQGRFITGQVIYLDGGRHMTGAFYA